MPFTRFDAATATLIAGVFDDAWFTLPKRAHWPPSRQADTIAKMTRQILAAADAGERDHDRLVQAALNGIDRS
jgi:hypothetical protein